MMPNDDFIKRLEQLQKGLDCFKQDLEIGVEQLNEIVRELKEKWGDGV